MNKTYNKSDYESIEQLFLMNQDKWFSGNYLKDQYQINTIKLQQIIHDLRVNGVLIISGGNKGYKYTKNKQEILATYLSLKNRATSINQAANGIYDAMLEMDLINDKGNHTI